MKRHNRVKKRLGQIKKALKRNKAGRASMANTLMSHGHRANNPSSVSLMNRTHAGKDISLFGNDHVGCKQACSANESSKSD